MYHEGMSFVTVMTDAAFHPSLGVTDPYLCRSCLAAHGGNHVTVYSGVPRSSDPFADLPRPSQATLSPTNREDPVWGAIQLAQDVGDRMLPLVRALPAQLAERLGFVQTLYPSEWAEVLFHLGWHFPDHGIEAVRFRILSGSAEFPPDFPCRELDLQLGAVRVSPDVFPGVIVSRLGEASDFLTASTSALRLIMEALDGTTRAAQPLPSAAFARLRDDFLHLAESYAHHPRELSVRVLRLGDSFRTPPATEWAGIDRGGDGWGIPRYYVLSQLAANRVVCELRGPGAETFRQLADRAGALLPEWPVQRYSALLSDVGSFARYCDPARFPWAPLAGDMWSHGMVTDHRGNEERWLGLVFGVLMATRREHLNLVTYPEDVAHCCDGGSVNAMMTLRGMNLFAASARD